MSEVPAVPEGVLVSLQQSRGDLSIGLDWLQGDGFSTDPVDRHDSPTAPATPVTGGAVDAGVPSRPPPIGQSAPGTPGDGRGGSFSNAPGAAPARPNAAVDGKAPPVPESPGASTPGAAPARQATPTAPLDCIAILMRAILTVTNSRDDAIFPFLGVVYVVAKLSCLVGCLDDVRRRVLFATFLNLFSTPSNALDFMAKTFEVPPGVFNPGGRLTPHRHLSRQPIVFRATDFGTLLNLEGQQAQWMSRSLPLRDGVSFAPRTALGTGALSRAKLDAFSARFSTHAAVVTASGVGCRVHYCGEPGECHVLSEVVVIWAILFGVDNDFQDLLDSLRPVLLRCAPQRMTQVGELSRRQLHSARNGRASAGGAPSRNSFVIAAAAG